MIRNKEVPVFLASRIPGLSAEFESAGSSADVYKAVHIFLDFTFANIRQHNVNVAGKCFAAAGRLYKTGSRTVKNAVENVFIYSLSNLPVANAAERKQLISALPPSLYACYMGQVMHPGA